MSDNFALLSQTVLTSSVVTQYTCPAATNVVVGMMVLANTSGANVSATIYSNGISTGNTILPGVVILAGGFGEWSGTLNMQAGDTISASASAGSSITMSVYGLKIT